MKKFEMVLFWVLFVVRLKNPFVWACFYMLVCILSFFSRFLTKKLKKDMTCWLCYYQVRSTGTVDQVTRQPIKGRKKGGGIRFGEMERDSMLAHGASYLLHDRLHTCSDHHIADVCSLCGSILTSTLVQPQKRAVREIGGLPPGKAPKRVICHACKTSKGMETVAMPYVFKYLAAELAAMNIRMTLQLSNAAGAWFEPCSCLRSLLCLVQHGSYGSF